MKTEMESVNTKPYISCDPCQNEGLDVPAEGYCVNCREHLCDSCFRIHRRPLPWKYHSLLNKQRMPTEKPSKQVNDDCTEPCPLHAGRIIEFFCTSHGKLGCSFCIIKYHRLCQNIDYIPDIAVQFAESNEVKELTDKCSSLLTVANKQITEAKEDLTTVEMYEQNAKTNVLRVREELNDFCDKIEEEIHFRKLADQNSIEQLIDKYSKLATRLQTSVTVIMNNLREQKIAQLFTAVKLTQTVVNEVSVEIDRPDRISEIQCCGLVISEENLIELRSYLEKNVKLASFKESRDRTEISPAVSIVEQYNQLVHLDGKGLQREECVHNDENKKTESNQKGIQAQAGDSAKDNVSNMSKEIKRATSIGGIEFVTTFLCEDQCKGARRKYDREFLLQLQYTDNARHKPADLQDVSSITIENGMAFIKENDSAEITAQTPGLPMKTVVRQLYRFLVMENADSATVIEWVETNVDETVRLRPRFIRSLMTYSCKNIVKDENGKSTLDAEKLLARRDLLRKFFNNQTELEIKALYALQSFISKLGYPKDILVWIFQVLYDAKVISRDAFFQWARSKDEPDGKEMCLKQTAAFFIWLDKGKQKS